jgi:hypothetical protein
MKFATLGSCSRELLKEMLEYVEPVVFTGAALKKMCDKGKRVEAISELLKVVTYETGLEPSFELDQFATDLEFFEFARCEAYQRGHRGLSLVLHPKDMFSKRGQGIYDYDQGRFQLKHLFTNVVYDVRDLFEKKCDPKTVTIKNNFSETLATLEDGQRKVRILLSTIIDTQFPQGAEDTEAASCSYLALSPTKKRVLEETKLPRCQNMKRRRMDVGSVSPKKQAAAISDESKEVPPPPKKKKV